MTIVGPVVVTAVELRDTDADDNIENWTTCVWTGEKVCINNSATTANQR
jgi:hypothetical protein